MRERQAKGLPVLEVSNLTIELSAGTRKFIVVDDVSFCVHPGEAMGLVGESGSGKTLTALSLVSLLPGVCRVVSGSVRLNGQQLIGLRERELEDIRGREVGMIFQDPMSSLDPCFTVGDQIAEVLQRHRNTGRKAAFEEAAALLDMVKIPDASKRVREYPHTFSGGMRQRVMIAMAIACRPKLLIADEPTTALDVTVQAQILDLISELQTNYDIAVVLVSHDLAVISNVCNHLSVMYAGQIVESGSRGQVFRSPQHPYTAALLSANLIHDKGKPLYSIAGNVPLPGKIASGCRFAPRCGKCNETICTGSDPELTRLGSGAQTRCIRNGEFELRGVS